MADAPDFKALAELWLSRDPRSAEMDPEARAKAVERLAEALRKRRESTDHEAQEVGLVVNIDRDEILKNGLSESALEQLTQIVRERIEENEH